MRLHRSCVIGANCKRSTTWSCRWFVALPAESEARGMHVIACHYFITSAAYSAEPWEVFSGNYFFGSSLSHSNDKSALRVNPWLPYSDASVLLAWISCVFGRCCANCSNNFGETKDNPSCRSKFICGEKGNDFCFILVQP